MDAPEPRAYFFGMPLRSLWLFLVLVGLGLPGASAQRAEIRLKHGDDPRWAAPDWDDSDWTPIKFSEYPAQRGVFWVRIYMASPGNGLAQGETRYTYVWPQGTADAPIDALFWSSVYSFELFLDGQRLEGGGVVGHDATTEKPGLLDHLVMIPEPLRARDRHVLAVRMSTFHYNFPSAEFSAGFQPVNFAERLRQETLQPVFPLIGAVGSLMMAATSLILFRFLDRRRALWLVSLVSLVLAVFYGLIAFRWLYPYDYDWHYPRLLGVTWTLTVASILLIWLLLEQFAAPRKAWWIGVLLPLLAVAWQASPIYEFKVLWICRAMLVVALAAASWAAWRCRPGARLALVGVGVALLVVRTDRRVFLDPTFFLMIEGLVLLVFAALGAQVQAERRRAREAQLTAARMEVELLKKNLQPHFLLNTLTAVSEVIEQDPKGAVKFIDDLATEFRSLASMSGERLVPLKRELALCRAHLKVISRRTGRTTALITEGVDEETLVPPALFLTLIENGLVHQRADAGADFRLEARSGAGGVQYVFLSPGRARATGARGVGGTGLRYVKARLEESFPGGWTLAQSAIPDGWQTTIGWRAPVNEGGIS